MSATSLPRPLAFVDLARQQDTIRHRIDNAIARVLDHGQYILGPEVLELEAQLAAFCGARHAITCGSGTDALLMALMAKDLRPGQAVVVPSFTFAATSEVVCLLGGTPVFADVQEDTFNLDADSLKMALLTARHLKLAIVGVISVDLFGRPCIYDPIQAVVDESGLWLICDAAQSFGASYGDRHVGRFGDMTATSFFPAKPLGCYGDGGAILTDDPTLACVLRSLRVHGQGKDKYDNIRIGINGRLDTIQAAVLLEKLAIFQREIVSREQAATRYDAILPPAARRPARPDGTTSVWAQYTVRVSSRDRVAAGLKARGVPAMIYYPVPLHLQTAYRNYPCAGNGLPVSTRLAESVLSLPMHPYLTPDEQQRVADELGHLL
jgi:dTDP-4-amino-4,6-dideoxygalactose transaminase